MSKIRITNIEDLKKLIQNINEDGSYDIELDDNLSFHAVSDEDFELLSEMKEMFEEEKEFIRFFKKIFNEEKGNDDAI